MHALSFKFVFQIFYHACAFVINTDIFNKLRQQVKNKAFVVLVTWDDNGKLRLMFLKNSSEYGFSHS